MSNLNTWFEKAMNRDAYVESMEKHKESLERVYMGFQLSDEDKQILAPLKEKKLRAISLTADWCGDAMVNLPIFMRIAEAAGIDDRYLIRDENLELMDQYLTNGTARSIPIIILIDQDGNETAKWGPRAPEVQEFVNNLRANVPPKEDPAHEAGFQLFIEGLTSRFTADADLWNSIKQDLLKTII
ncbi:thioredoxin family protein [Peribacillus sp. B-H-3]|uniref:thioredoxin family protein n=1 Tax=Peribacillus sp. B-H-3 TaxID=3400420 RepID=UPI003B01C1C0